jgi:predicted nucleotidyltransferase
MWRGMGRTGQAVGAYYRLGMPIGGMATRGIAMDVNNPTDKATMEVVQAFVYDVARKYDVSDAILFGSRARGNPRSDSDADVAVILRGEPGDFVDTKLAMADIAYDVFLKTGMRILVQAWPIWEDEWRRPQSYENPSLLRNIEREGVHFGL